MAKLTLTEKDFKKTDNYWSEYVGKTDVSDYKGDITIKGSLGWVRFNSIKVYGYLIAEAGTGIKAGDAIKAGTGIKAGDGIEAGWGIEAGTGIEAGWGIKAGEGIKAGTGIEAGEGIKAGTGIEAGWGIEAGEGIEAGTGIEAGWGIKAGDGIKAGEGIEAGWGIEAGDGIEAGWGIEAGTGIISGLSITCKLVLSFNYRLFAGITWFRNTDNEEKTITCGKLKGGIVCYGDVTETGLPDEPKETEKINIGGKDYEVTPESKDALKKLKEV